IRHVQNDAGTDIPATPAFAALRDGTPFADASIEARRTLYAGIFDKLKAAGIDKAGLQIAWDFSTSSRDNNTAWMIHMRDDALKVVGEDGPEYTIDKVTDNPYDDTARKIEGTM